MSEEEKLLKEAKKLPWEDRLSHKNWKVRNDANIDLAALLDTITDPKDPRLREFGFFFKKTVSDSNAPVQDKALDALIAYLKAADADAARYAKEICDAVVAKCLTGRPKTIEKAQNVFLLWVELEAAEVFLEAMEKAVKNKVAKAVVPAIDVMFQAVSEFGTKVVPPKKILKMLSELFDHQDQNVRTSAKGLTIELCRWIGKDTVKSILFEKMRDTMKKELEGELANVSGVPKPTRKIRSEQQKELEIEITEEVSGAEPVEEGTVAGSQDIDEYDLVDPVDILTPLEKTGFWEGVKASKWSERRDAVAELTKLASAKKIAPGDFSEVCRTLKKLITDVNLAVAVEAVQATGNLSRGLRKEFSAGSRLLLPTLLEKLKEKKAVMSDALVQTLQSMHKGGALSLLDVVEDVKSASKNKVPSVRSLTLNWVTFCIESSNKATVLKLHKDYIPICMECLNDGTPEVRDAAFSALAAVAKIVGMRPLEKSLDKLDDIRRKKLTEMIGIAEAAQTAGQSSGHSGASRLSHTVSGSASEGSQTGSVKRSAASVLTGKKAVSLSTTKKTGSSRQGAGKKVDDGKQSKASSAKESVEDLEPLEMSLEEIEGKIGSLFQDDVLMNLKSSVWKERLEAMTSLKETVEGLSELEQHAEILVQLVSVLPGWNEKNVQVQQKVLEVITHIASTVTKLPKRSVVLCIPGVAEKVADIKTRIQATKCLTAFCESIGPGLIFDRLCKVMKEHKNPKVLTECLLWMVTAVEDFGASHIKLKELIDFCKEVGLQSSAAATRNATTKLIGILHKFVGPDLKSFFGDVKPAILTAIDAEFEKNPYEGPDAAPKKTIRDPSALAVSYGSGSDGLPREDISKRIPPTLISNMSSPDWKLRLESIEGVNKLLEEANNRIQPTGTGELFGALRARLSDSNKNLVMSTLSVIGNIASAMGPAVEKSSKGILSDVLRCLSDNKKHMRESVMNTLDSWVSVVQLDKMVPYIVVVCTEVKLSPDGRKDLFEWVTKQLAKINDQPDVAQLLKPTSVALLDKSAEVRKAAESALAEIVRVSGHDMMVKVMKELQGPALNAVLERHRLPGMVQGLHFAEAAKPLTAVSAARTVVKHSKNTVSSFGERLPSRASHRGLASKGPQSKHTKQVIPVVAEDYAVQGLPLFNLRDSNKEDREKPISRKYKFEELRVEQIQELENDLLKYFREDLHRRLLSTDFKKHVDGLDLLQKAISTHVKEMTEVVDILLRWIVLRFCESNTTCLLKVLEFLPELVEALKNEGYVLTEYEANILLPCLMEKSGHNIEKVREKMRDLIKLVSGIYPPPKLFNFVLEGLRSKNNRSRIECVDHIGYMIDQYGIEIAGPSRALQTVASLTSERDGELRKAALNTLATAYKILGEDIWRYVGKLAEAQKSMLDDRFKWKAREMEKRKEGRPGEARAALRRSVRDNGFEAIEQSGGVIPRPISTHSLPSIRAVHGHLEAYSDQPHVSGPPIVLNPSSWNEAVELINHGSPEQAVEGMRYVCQELNHCNNDPENPAMENLVRSVDGLVSSLTRKVANTFGLVLSGASPRSCKHLLNTLMQIFQIKKIAHGVKKDTLQNLITELLLCFLVERLQVIEDGSQLLKALNVLMLKILENADRTSAFVVLIRLLQPLDPSRWHSPLYGDAEKKHKFSDLVVKCLIRLTKVLQHTISEVDLDILLESIHQYLQELGMDEIRRRAGADDKPLRMVKTVLHELVRIRGTAIKGHLSHVPIDTEPQPIILAYIELNLQTLAAARILNPSGAASQPNWGDSTSGPGGTHSPETQLKQELAAIFKKIGDKQTCSIGLYELHQITRMYPQVDIFAQLQNASEAFRTYIREGLSQIERSSATGRTPSSVPISTPPPVTSPGRLSPKMAPPSPLDERMQDVTVYQNGSTVTTDQEDVETNVSGNSDMQNSKTFLQTRLLASQYDGSVLAAGERKSNFSAQNDTLDAVREKVKSIKAAAGNPVTKPHNLNASQREQPIFIESNVHRVGDSISFEADRQLADAPPKDEGALSVLQARMDRLKSGFI